MATAHGPGMREEATLFKRYFSPKGSMIEFGAGMLF